MAQVTSEVKALSFTGTMKDLVFTTGYAKTQVTITVTGSDGAITVLSETFWPDTGGTITITEMGALFAPYCRQYGSVTVSVTLQDYDSSDNAVGTASTVDLGTVLYAEVDPIDGNGQDMDASEFCSKHFLTILDGEKITAYGRKESLSAYGASTVTVSAVVRNLGKGKFSTKSATLNPINNTGGIYLYDVSESNVEGMVALDTNDERIVSYTVSAGERSQSYRVVEDEVAPSPALCFLNSFKCWEYIYCTGTHTKSSDYTRSTAQISGKTRNFKIQEKRSFKAQTGVLNRAMAAWADDLFRSDEVYLYTGGKMGKDIIITESKSEIKNDDDDLPSFEFTWQYAQKLHNILESELARIRVFDSTFDYTFE